MSWKVRFQLWAMKNVELKIVQIKIYMYQLFALKRV
jgi:hypothetical protein